MAQIGFCARAVAAEPFPEKRLDVGLFHVAGDIIDRFVVDRDDRLANKWTPLGIGQF